MSLRNFEHSAEVSIVRGVPPLEDDKIFSMVKEAVDLIGGIRKLVKPGEKVLINPNMQAPFPPPVTVDPRVVKALVQLCRKEAETDNIIVGERTSAVTRVYRKKSTAQVSEKTGMTKAVEEAGGSWLPFDEYDWVEVQIPGALVARKVVVTKAFEECDAYIPITVFTVSEDVLFGRMVKKPIGILDDEHIFKWHRQDLFQKVVDLYRYVKPKCRLAIMDGIVAQEGALILGAPVALNLIVASTDSVAIDAVCCDIAGIRPREIHHVRLADFYGLGCADLSRISVRGYPLEEAKKIHGPFKRATAEVAGVYPKVDVLPGGVCESCKWWARMVLEHALAEGVLEKITDRFGRLCFIMGVSPQLPEKPSDIEGLPIIFGDCAIRQVMADHNWNIAIEVAEAVPGCPKPDPAPLIVPGCPPLRAKQYYRELKKLVLKPVK
jgi:uncharacterized protein (DUF362 family)